MADSYDRPIWQIALKTVVTHACALVAYAAYNNLLHVPSKHNARFFRLVVFAFVPTVLLGQFAFDIVKAAIRALQNPHELDLGTNEAKHSLRFYWDGILGVRSIPATDNEAAEPQREEPTRLLDVASPTDVRPPKRSWTWKRTVQLLITLLVMAQAIAVIVMFARRSIHRSCRMRETPCHDSYYHKCNGRKYDRYTACSHSTISLDVRNLYIACASTIASILSTYLILAGNTWTNTPVESLPLSGEESSNNRVSGVMGEMKRLTFDFIIGAAIQELIAVKVYWYSDGAPFYPTSLVHALASIHLRLTEWVPLAILIFLLAIFRNDIILRLGIKVNPAYFFKVLGGILVTVVAGWFVVDCVGLVVTDIGHFVTGHYGAQWSFGERWNDPVEKWVPFI